MPELPEVETLCRQLRKKICGQIMIACEVTDEKLPSMKRAQGKRVVAIERVGKEISMNLDDGLSIRIHLRMSGRLFWRNQNMEPDYVRCVWRFCDGDLLLCDPRRFATVHFRSTKRNICVNDFSTCFDEKRFLKRHAHRSINIKSLLMEPKAIAGIGNIYACEILHQSNVYPFRKANTLTLRDWKNVFENAKRILENGIRKRGTSISDWRDLYGRKGSYQNELQVYGRAGETCQQCGSKIIRVKQAGRSTYFCLDCQK